MNTKLKISLKTVAFILGLTILCFVVWDRSRRVDPGREGLGSSFDFDLDKYQDVDPALITYDEGEAIPIGLDAVSALAVGPDGAIYAGGGKIVLVLDKAGSETARIDLDGTVSCLAVDSDGTVFAGIDNHVEVFDKKGTRKAKWEAEAEDAMPVSIALRGDAIFVGEARKGQVLQYDRAGVLVDSIQGFVLFSSPILGMAVDAEQNLWTANPGGRELRRYAPNGTMDMQWNRAARSLDGFSGCCNPVDIAIRADGNIVTTEKSIVRVKVVSPKGELIGVVAGPRSFDQDIKRLDVAIDAEGRVLVLDPVKKSVRVFVEK